ncbi:MAG: hypothetical protein SFW62_02400 [Alphaproteobacteria bacterium]|nr:hypothetical protein [Alphaproteobacteria bacterium]
MLGLKARFGRFRPFSSEANVTEEKITYWASMVFGVFALILLIANISLISSNRGLQQDISQRQMAINGGMSLAQVNKGVVQALAEAAVKDGDAGARELLAAQGITVAAAKGSERKEAKESKESHEDKSQ